MIKGIIIDLDGMYFLEGKENFVKAVASKFNIPSDDVATMFFSSNEMMDYKRGRTSDELYWQTFIDKLKITTAQSELINLLISGYKPDERIYALVKALKEKDYKTIICSNNFPARVKGLEEQFHFLENFTVRVFSFEVGYLKLDGTKMYDEVVAKSGLVREEILMIDNGSENIAFAKGYGFNTIWYRDYLHMMEELEKLGVKI